MLARDRHGVVRWAPLAVSVFLIGAAIGATIVTAHRHQRNVVVERRAVGAITDGTAAAHTGSTKARVKHSPAPQRTAPAPTANQVVAADARASFDSLAASVPGRVGIAVAPLGAGPITTLGALQGGHAWSTMKVPVLVTLLSDDRSSRQALGPAEQTDATAALEHSDNPAAEALFAELEQRHGGLVGASQALQRTLQRAGDTHVTVNTAPNDQGFTTWGQSIWSTSGEIDFYRSLAAGCLLDPQDTAYVLGLMQHVVPAQRWGAGAAGYPSGILLAFKAGWGPEANGGYVVRQTAIVGTEGRGYVVSMIALPSDGSFADGVALIDNLARWAREHVITTQHGPVGCPSR